MQCLLQLLVRSRKFVATMYTIKNAILFTLVDTSDIIMSVQLGRLYTLTGTCCSPTKILPSDSNLDSKHGKLCSLISRHLGIFVTFRNCFCNTAGALQPFQPKEI